MLLECARNTCTCFQR